MVISFSGFAFTRTRMFWELFWEPFWELPSASANWVSVDQRISEGPVARECPGKREVWIYDYLEDPLQVIRKVFEELMNCLFW